MAIEKRVRDRTPAKALTPTPPRQLSEKEALNMLVRFATVDLDKVRPGEYLDLVDDVRRYLNVEGPGRVADALKRAETDRQELRAAIDVARGLVETIADRRSGEWQHKAGMIRVDASGARPVTYQSVSLEDAILMVGADDLDEAATERIGRCRRCKQVFLGQKGQMFCGRKCANAETARRYREKHPARRRAQAKRYYKGKIQKKHGPNVKVENRGARSTDTPE